MDLEFGRPTVSRQLFYLCAEFTYWTVARDSILLNRKFTFSPPIHYNFLGFRASLSKTYYIYVKFLESLNCHLKIESVETKGKQKLL